MVQGDGACYYQVLPCSDLKLNEPLYICRKYGVFQTHEGFHRFKSLCFGHNQATQAFSEDVKKSLQGLSNTESVADNILVHSKTAVDHKKHLMEFLNRVREEGITLSLTKVKACQEEVLWFGHVYGKNGVRPDPAKVKKLKEKVHPQIKKKCVVSCKQRNSMRVSCGTPTERIPTSHNLSESY